MLSSAFNDAAGNVFETREHKGDFQRAVDDSSFSRWIQIALSNSKNAVSFSSERAMKRFPSSQCASAIKVVRPFAIYGCNTSLKLHPASLRHNSQREVIAVAAFVVHLVSVAVAGED